MIDFGRACARHRPILVDFVDRGEIRPGTGAALEHLDRCRHCKAAIESTVLTILALRRFAATLDQVAPPPDAWPRLAERIAPRRRRSLVMSPISGAVFSLAFVVANVVLLRLGPAQEVHTTSSANASAAVLAVAGPDAIRPADWVHPKPVEINDPFVVDNDTSTVGARQVVDGDIIVIVKEVSLGEPSWQVARAI